MSGINKNFPYDVCFDCPKADPSKCLRLIELKDLKIKMGNKSIYCLIYRIKNGSFTFIDCLSYCDCDTILNCESIHG